MSKGMRKETLSLVNLSREKIAAEIIEHVTLRRIFLSWHKQIDWSANRLLKNAEHCPGLISLSSTIEMGNLFDSPVTRNAH